MIYYQYQHIEEISDKTKKRLKKAAKIGLGLAAAGAALYGVKKLKDDAYYSGYKKGIKLGKDVGEKYGQQVGYQKGVEVASGIDSKEDIKRLKALGTADIHTNKYGEYAGMSPEGIRYKKAFKALYKQQQAQHEMINKRLENDPLLKIGNTLDKAGSFIKKIFNNKEASSKPRFGGR